MGRLGLRARAKRYWIDGMLGEYFDNEDLDGCLCWGSRTANVYKNGIAYW